MTVDSYYLFMLVRSKGPLIIQEFNTHMIKHFTFTQSALINIKIKVSVRSRTAQTFIPPLWWVGWGDWEREQRGLC